MRLWRRRRGFVQSEAAVAAELGSDLQTDMDAIGHDEQKAFDELGADPDEVSGLAEAPLPADQRFGNAIDADLQAEERDEDRMLDAFRDKDDGVSGD